MMVQVIGKDESKVYKVSCPNCASILQYTKSEVHSVKKNYDYLGDYDLVNCVTCPQCNYDVSVKN